MVPPKNTLEIIAIHFSGETERMKFGLVSPLRIFFALF